ncbi:MAG: hypothetical protein V4617_01790 [Gemmatimonadota bacterium]
MIENLNSFIDAANAHEAEYAESTGLKLAPNAAQQALCDLLGLSNPIDLLTQSWNVDRIRSLLCAMELETASTVVEEILLLKPLLPAVEPRLLTEQTIDFDSEQWRIHKNDADPFPSNPHAHCLGYPLKLHLGTGVLYKKRKVHSSVPWKDFLAFRVLIKYAPLPPLDKKARAQVV